MDNVVLISSLRSDMLLVRLQLAHYAVTSIGIYFATKCSVPLSIKTPILEGFEGFEQDRMQQTGYFTLLPGPRDQPSLSK